MDAEPCIIACACGAAYERRVVDLPIKDIGVFECAECGAQIEHWSARKVPVFARAKAHDVAKRKRA